MAGALDYKDKLELYEKVVAAAGLERKGKTMPYTSVNGHMFSFLAKDSVVAVRLPKEAREKFLKDFDSKLPVQYGAVMKEYVEIPDKLLRDTKKLLPYVKQSYKYVSSLKPKPTSRGNKK